jgi:hypothetical protein
MTNNEDIYRQGRRRLKEWAPQAKARARKAISDPKGIEIHPGTLLGQKLFARLSEKNLDAVLVYEDPHRPGRWHGDVLLKNTPIGMPNSFGTQRDAPVASRKEAERQAFGFLIGVYRHIIENEMSGRDVKPTDERVFALHGHELSLPGELIDSIASAAVLMTERETGTAEDVRNLLDAKIERMTGGGEFTIEAWDAAPEELQRGAIANMVMLLVMGVFRHPDRVPAPESDGGRGSAGDGEVWPGSDDPEP